MSQASGDTIQYKTGHAELQLLLKKIEEVEKANVNRRQVPGVQEMKYATLRELAQMDKDESIYDEVLSNEDEELRVGLTLKV